MDANGASAIISTPDRGQKLYRVGDAICCNATLSEIYADNVTILRAGAKESLRLRRGPEPANIGRSGKSNSEVPMVQYRITEIIRMEPVGEDGAVQFRLFPGANESAFTNAGLLPGDMLVSVDGNPAPPDMSGLAQLLTQLKDGKEVQITVQRDGVDIPIEIPISSLAQGL
jgi:type II secretion system protein C